MTHDQDIADAEGAPPDAPSAGSAPPDDGPTVESLGIDLGETVDEAAADLATVSAQRDEYLAVAQRLQAEFENYRKRVSKELTDTRSAGKADLAGKLLSVLDAFDSAIIQGVEGIAPIHKVLFETLTKEGLEAIVADDTPFDPNLHDAVMHEPADGADEPTVAETLRTGYLWNGRVLRPAMVKVRG